jgi:hypothetical protein
MGWIGTRQRGRDRVGSRPSAMIEGRAEVDPIEPETSAGRTTFRQARRIAAQMVAKQAEHRHADLGATLTSVAREVKHILLVDPNHDGLGEVQAALGPIADVEVCSEFRIARARLLANPPDLLVTNLRLEAYNGLHLVHLAAGTRTRCIAYAIHDDLVLAREVRLSLTLPSYVNATLPRHDRRDPTVLERRLTFRGGRRSTDRPSNIWLVDPFDD